MPAPFAPIPDILAALKRGEMIVLVDDEDRENEGDLVMAAEAADARAIAFMATRGCGLICLAMDGAIVDRLGLPLMARDHRSPLGTAFTLSIEAREGVTTGISAGDRARTIQAAIADDATPEDIVVPGHIFPLRARDGGVLVRAGHSEASVDLARLAGMKPAGVICEIMKPDGTMARLPDLIGFARDHGLLLASIADVIAWREDRERLVRVVAESTLELPEGRFRAYAFENTLSGEQHLALVAGERLGPGREVQEPVLVRVQKESALRAFASVPGAVDPRICLRQIAEGGGGVLLSVHDHGGHLLSDDLAACAGKPPPPRAQMDPRDYGIGAQILRAVGVRRMILITGSGRHMTALSGHGLEVAGRVRPGEQAAAAG